MKQEKIELLAKLTAVIYAAQITNLARQSPDYCRAMRDAKEIIRLAELSYPERTMCDYCASRRNMDQGHQPCVLADCVCECGR